MPNQKERLEKLVSWGLTEYEGRAYLALLELGEAEASSIADVAHIPRTKIYQALEGLESKRLLEVIPERPKKYRVLSLEIYLEEREKSLLHRAEEIRRTRSDLLSEFEPKRALPPQEAGSFLILKGRANIQSRIVESLERAQREIRILTSPMGLRRWAYHSEALEEAESRGVVVRVLSSSERGGEEMARFVEGEAPKTLGPTTIVVADRDAFIVHHVPDDHHVFQGNDVALYSNDPGLVLTLLALLDLVGARGGQVPQAESLVHARMQASTS